MDEPWHPADEPVIKRVLQVARDGIFALPKGDRLRQRLEAMVASILAGCNEIDDQQNLSERDRFIEVIEAAFVIGAIVGKPSDASTVGAGRKGKGGKVQGKKSQERAASHMEALTPIFLELRARNPAWLDSRLIREARTSYGNRTPVLPGERQLANYVAEMIAEGVIPNGPKDGRAKKF